MKNKKLLGLLVLSVATVFGVTACGADQSVAETGTWVVDKEAWDEEVWVVDKEAWDEEVEGQKAYFCIKCGETLPTEEQVITEDSEIGQSNPERIGEVHEVFTEESLAHIKECNSRYGERDVTTIHHEEEGHYETIHHEEEGHYE